MERRMFGLPIGSQEGKSQQVSETDETGRPPLRTREFELRPAVSARLTKEEAQILNILVRAARRTANLYLLQEAKEEGFDFYPPKITKSEVLKAAEEDSEIRSPYTIVRQTPDGSLEAVPMHTIYAIRLKQLNIPNYLREAANFAGRGRKRDISLQAYLRAKARSLETGDYESSERIWLEREDEPKIDIVIGLYDTYTDKLLGAKYSWGAWVGVLDEKGTHDSQWFLDSFLNWWEQETGQHAPKVRMRVDHTRMLGGQAALYDWTGNSLPCQQEWRQKYGSKFTIFRPRFETDFKEKKLPAFRSLIDPSRRMGVPDSLVKTVSLRKHIGHETSHALGVAPDLEIRLQEFAAPIKELYCDLLALKGYFAIPGISMRERELAFATFFADGVIEYANFHNEGKREEYYVAHAVPLKFCLKKGSIKVEDGRLTWEDPRQVMNDIILLLDEEVQKIQIEGGVKEAKNFFAEYYDDNTYGQLRRGEVPIPHFLRRRSRRKTLPKTQNVDTRTTPRFVEAS